MAACIPHEPVAAVPSHAGRGNSFRPAFPLGARHQVVDARVLARVVARRGREHRGDRHALLLEKRLKLALDECRVLQVELVPSKLLDGRQERQLDTATERCVAAVVCCEAIERAVAGPWWQSWQPCVKGGLPGARPHWVH